LVPFKTTVPVPGVKVPEFVQLPETFKVPEPAEIFTLLDGLLKLETETLLESMVTVIATSKLTYT
jgi:hypothetical protein